LARAAGVTVRTLRHYDGLGLLEATGRTRGGHRRYNETDVARLFQILALRNLGLALNEVASLLDSDDSSALLTTARAQREQVQNQLGRYQALRSRLAAVIDGLQTDGADNAAPPTDQILDALETMAMTVHLTRIYTRRGDDGNTDLADRSRVAKVEPRVEAIGAVDELNAALGLALTAPGLDDDHAAWLRQIQNDLFDIGAELAQPPPVRAGDIETTKAGVPASQVTQSYVTWLEERCDAANADLPALRSFVLPGGTSAAAHLHLARTVCRRAERRVLAVPGVDPVNAQYLNRLSDLLFILSRANNRNADEPLWQPARRPPVDGGTPTAT
jgi:cob(I)alamin adenosyltransferase